MRAQLELTREKNRALEQLIADKKAQMAQKGEQEKQTGEQMKQKGEQEKQIGEQEKQKGEQMEQKGEQVEQIGEQMEQIEEQEKQKGEQVKQKGEQEKQIGEQVEQEQEKQQKEEQKSKQMKECPSSHDTKNQMHENEKDKVATKSNSDNNSNNSKEKVTGAVPKQKQTGKKQHHNKQNGGGRACSEAPRAAQLKMPEVQYASAPTTPGRLLSPEPTTANNDNSQLFPLGETATADDAQEQRNYNLLKTMHKSLRPHKLTAKMIFGNYVVQGSLKVHNYENLFGSDFKFSTISLLVMLKY
jgi:hypothetical protein